MSDEKNPMIRTVRVTTIKEIRVELTPAVFGGMSEKQYLEELRQGLWDVEGMDDIFQYAARMAAIGGGCQHDALGLVSESHTRYPRVPDVKFDVLDEDVETEIIT